MRNACKNIQSEYNEDRKTFSQKRRSKRLMKKRAMYI